MAFVDPEQTTGFAGKMVTALSVTKNTQTESVTVEELQPPNGVPVT